MHNFFTNSIYVRKPTGIMQNTREIRGSAYLKDMLEHLLSKSKIRGWLVCEIGLYGVYTVAHTGKTIGNAIRSFMVANISTKLLGTGGEMKNALFPVFILLMSIVFRNVNDDIMEMLIYAYACRTASARKIVGVMPYMPYSKQSKMRKRGSIVCKLVASMLEKAGQEGLLLNLCSEISWYFRVDVTCILIFKGIIYLNKH